MRFGGGSGVLAHRDQTEVGEETGGRWGFGRKGTEWRGLMWMEEEGAGSFRRNIYATN